MFDKFAKLKIELTEKHKAKICLDCICEFMSLIKEDFDNPEKPNFTTEDFSLRQFQQRVGKKL